MPTIHLAFVFVKPTILASIMTGFWGKIKIKIEKKRGKYLAQALSPTDCLTDDDLWCIKLKQYNIYANIANIPQPPPENKEKYLSFPFKICTVHCALPSSRATTLHLQPGVVHRRRHGRGDGGRADVADDAERLPQGVVHPQHLVTVLGLLLRLLHQGVLVAARVQLSQQVGVDVVLRLEAKRGRCIVM